MWVFKYRTFSRGCSLRPRRMRDENWIGTYSVIIIIIVIVIIKDVLYVILAVLPLPLRTVTE